MAVTTHMREDMLMLSDTERFWTLTMLAASCAIAFAIGGLAVSAVAPAAPAYAASTLLIGSLASTAAAFTLLAVRIRRLETENAGLVEELSQEFERVKDKLEIYGDALQETQRVPLRDAEMEANTPMRRVPLK